MNTISTLLLAFLISTTAFLSAETRPEILASGKEKARHSAPNSQKGGGEGRGGFFGPGGGFNIPGMGNGWNMGGGYGAGFGGPNGGYAKGGVVRPSVVCKEKGPCYKKKLICPAKCFSSYSHAGKNYGGGGGGGGCTMDCKKKCVAYC
ncbi:dormancy-associated protein 2 [Diospyros lotus]|uniref:dormancy-associated protein 2 n=1 Tax=Diospyros lotus TaxID=55363 RepID=UPI00224F411F|nr:dormancy-associated protein 2 [Diospyros lotus]